MRDVAKVVGVATSTVSKALRNDPSIPPSRCQEIQTVASRLGYRPDPMVATLMAQLHHRRRRSDPHNLAWIDLWGPERSRAVMNPGPMLEGARQRADELGYGIEVYRAGVDKISPDRLRRMLTTRGQWGLIIPAVPESAMHFPFDLRGFSGVTIGTSLHEPVMHRVSPNHFQGCVLAFQRLRQQGLRRIGIALSPEVNERVEGKWLGAFLFSQHQLPDEERVSPLIIDRENHEVFTKWLQTEKPDAILVAEEPGLQFGRMPLRFGIKPPVICSLTGSDNLREKSGLDYQPEQFGSISVEMVVAQIHRNERGSPAIPHQVLIDSIWVEPARRSRQKRSK